MTPNTPKNAFLFERMVVCLAILSPIVMVIVAGMLPAGSRGTMIVTGHEYLAAILVIAVALRVVHLRVMARRAARFSRSREARRTDAPRTAPQRTSLRVSNG
jgi:ABC-type proline/glycine betaine transport system permease subunit